MKLSRTQQVCIIGVAMDKPQRLIARDLGMKLNTLRKNIQRAQQRLGVNGVAGLTRWAVERGLVPALEK